MNPFWPAGQAIPVSAREGCPITFRWDQRIHRIQQVSAHWRVHTNWWAEVGSLGERERVAVHDEARNAPERENHFVGVWRDYWEATTDTGLLCVLYHDLRGDAWYLERIYE
jgi:hypothetical protein